MEQAQSVQNFKLCDQVADEISLKAKWRELESNVHNLQQKKKSDQYYVRKVITCTSDSSAPVDLTSHSADDGNESSAAFFVTDAPCVTSSAGSKVVQNYYRQNIPSNSCI